MSILTQNKICFSAQEEGGMKCMSVQYCLFIYIDSSALEEKQVYHDVVSPLLPEFFTSSIDFYLPQDKLYGKSQITNQQKAQYLLNVTLRDLFLSKVLVHKYQCREIAHAPVEELIWNSGVSLV